MPFVALLKMSSVEIVITNPQDSYCTGQTVNGLVRVQVIDSKAIGSVVVTFTGRVKTKIHRRTGKTSHIYRGRLILFSLSETLYTGHYTHKAGSYNWPFCFIIPARPQSPEHIPYVDDSGPWDTYQDLLSTEEQYQLNGLPSTCNFNFNYHSADEAFIEYKLEAIVSEPDDKRRLFGPGRFSTVRLLDIYHPTHRYHPQDYDLQAVSSILSLQSLRLLPEYRHDEAKLSFKQKAHAFFHPGSLPQFRFKLSLHFPRIVVPNSPNAVPILLSYEPISLELCSSEQQKDGAASSPIVHPSQSSMPPVFLRKAELNLQSSLHYRAGSFLHNSIGIDREQLERHSLLRENALNVLLSQTEAFDLSQILPADRTFATFSQTIYPSFRTTLIALRYIWRWRIVVQTCGEQVTFSDEIFGKVLPVHILGQPFYLVLWI